MAASETRSSSPVAARALFDLSLLFLLVGAVCTLSFVFGLSTTDYLRFAPVFALFLLPGWCLSAPLLGPAHLAQLVVRFPLAFLLSYLLYAWVALFCRATSLGYDTFFLGFAIGSAAAAVVWWRRAQWTTWSSVAREWRENALVVLVILLSAIFFTFPVSGDQGLFDANVFQSLDLRNFAPSALDVQPFGLQHPQPRMQANLFHAFFSVLAVAADVSPRVLIYYVAPPFLGIFLLLSMTNFVASVSGQKVNKAFALAAVMAPWTLFYGGGLGYWYEFRILNSPTLDKDFATFFLLPALLYLAWKYLREGHRKWLWLFGLGIPAAIWSHPVVPIYLLLACGVAAIALVRRDRFRRSIEICGLAAAGILLCLVFINPSGGHAVINELIELDLANERTHFELDHYTSEGHNRNSTVAYFGDHRPFLRARVFFGSALVRESTSFCFVWIVFFAIRWIVSSRGAGRGRASRRPLVSASGAALASIPVYLLSSSSFAMSTTLLLVTAGLAIAGLGLLLAASLWAAEATPQHQATDEELALRVQGAYAGVLVLLYVGAAVALAFAPWLWRGLNRLHWFYFGFFPFVFVAVYVWLISRALLERAIGRVGSLRVRRGLTGLVSAVPLLLLALHVADQSWAFSRQTPTILGRTGLAASTVDGFAWGTHYLNRHWVVRNQARWIRSLDGERGARALLALPHWMRHDDVILHMSDRLVDKYRVGRYKYQVLKHSAYYRELYSEAFALQQRRSGFLPSFHAYNDAIDGRVTPRLLQWLKDRGVTVILTRKQGFIRKLQEQWPTPIQRFTLDEPWPGLIRGLEMYGFRIR